MKKWDDQQRLKNFQSKIKNAKPQVPLTSNPKSSSKIKDQTTLNQTLSSQRSSITGYYNNEKDDKDSIPLYRLLKLHNLQQYAQFLISRGYGYDLTKFTFLTSKELDKMTEEMKVLPGHKTKFLDLINFINDLMPQMSEFQPKLFSPDLSSQGGSTQTQQKRKTHQTQNGNIFKKAPATAKTAQAIRSRPSIIQAERPLVTADRSNAVVRQQSANSRGGNRKGSKIIPAKKLKINTIGVDFFKDEDDMDSEFAKALDNILQQYQTSQSTTWRKPQLATTPMRQTTQAVANKHKTAQVQDDINVVHQMRDDKLVIQYANNKMMRNLEKRLTQTKTKKKPNKYQDEVDENYPDLQMSQVKMMYQSFDSGKLTSTLINLDIEEMCNCLAWAIVKHIQFNNKKPSCIDSIVKSQIQSIVRSMPGKNGDVSQNPMEEPTYYYGYNDPQTGLFQSQMNKPPVGDNWDPKKVGLKSISEHTMQNRNRGQDNEILDTKQQIEHILKESLLDPRQFNGVEEEEEDDFMADQFYEENSSEEYQSDESPIKRKYQHDQQPQPFKIEAHRQQRSQMQHSQELDDSLQYEDESGLHNYTQSNNKMDISMESKYEVVDNDEDDKGIYQIYQKTYYDGDQSLSQAIPTQEVVSNYCKNIITTSKMEKEVTIICLVYIERLLIKVGLSLEPGNWRRITFTALILASKIWDDESFENDNFAKAFPQYSTKQINELERVFLKLIDYSLFVKSSDYAKYYFILRTFAESRKKSFPLKPLDLNTILYLQRNANKAQRTLKDHYNNPHNKSF